MNTKFLSRWETFRFNFWFIPLIMILLTAGLAASTLWMDATIASEVLEDIPWIYVGTPDRSLFLLSVLAGAMVTVAALVFTVTVVALTLASSQYGHRLLRTYISDPGNQTVTGMFICTFIYCIIVLHSAPGLDAPGPTPHISVTVAALLAFVSFGLLIYYLHHASTSLQVEIFAAGLGHNLLRAIRREHSEPGERPEPGASDGLLAAEDASQIPQRGTTVCSRREGYIRFIDYDRLLKLASRRGLRIKILEQPGRFIIPGKPLAEVRGEPSSSSRLEARINRCFWTGPMRILTQDIRYGIDQLVEVALRALDVNAPFTAMGCIEWIGEAMSLLARRDPADVYLYDRKGRVRVERQSTDFVALTDSAFNQLRQFSYDVPEVSIRMLDVIALIMANARRRDYRDALLRHARMIEQGKASLIEERDKEELSRRYARVAAIAAAEG